MKTRTPITRLAVGALTALVAATAFAAAAGATPAPAREQAEMLRSQALNIVYGLGKPDEMTHAQYRAALIRSAALNERYGLPVALTSAQIARMYGTRGDAVAVETPATPAPPVSVPSADRFEWTDAAIGAAFAAGLFLLAAAGTVFARRHGHVRPPLHH